MADVQPLRALHYNLDKVGPLDRLTAPPYDVIDADLHADLAGRSPYNVVSIDLPQGDDPYANAAELLESWRRDGVIVQDSEPALWVLTQTYTAPDGSERVRSGFFSRVRLVPYGPGLIRPHERTHPAAKEDRLRRRGPRRRTCRRSSRCTRMRTASPRRRWTVPPQDRRGERSPTPTARFTASGASATPG